LNLQISLQFTFWRMSLNKIIVIVLWFCASNASAQKAPQIALQEGHESAIITMAFSTDGNRILSGDIDGRIVLWDIPTRKEYGSVNFNDPILKITTFDSTSFAIGFTSGTIVILSSYNLSLIKQIKLTIVEDEFKDFLVSADQHLIVAFSKKGIALTKNGAKYKYIDSKLKGVSKLFKSNNGFIASTNRKIEIFEDDAKSGFQSKGDYSCGWVKEIVFSEENRSFTALHIDKYLVQIKLAVPIIPVHSFSFDSWYTKKKVVSFTALSNGGYLCISNEPMLYYLDKKLKVTDQQPFPFRNPTELIKSPDGKTAAISSGKTIVLLELSTGQKIAELKGDYTEILFAENSADKESIIVGFFNGEIRLLPLNPNNREYITNLPLSANKRWKGWYFHPTEVLSDSNNIIEFKAIRYKVTTNRHTKNRTFENVYHYNCTWNVLENKLDIYEIKVERNLRALNVDELWKDFRLAYYKKDTTLYQSETNNKYGFELAIERKNVISLSTANRQDPIAMGSLNMILFNNGGCIYQRGEYYFATKDASSKVAFKIPSGNIYLLEQLDPYYNRPELVFKDIPFVDKTMVELYARARAKRWSKLGITNETPDLENAPEITVEREHIYTVEKGEYPIKVSCSDKKSISSLHVFVNGVPYQNSNLELVNKSVFDITITLELSDGLNHIRLFALNNTGISSRSEEFEVFYKHKSKKTLYLISVGVSKYEDEQFTLEFSAKDAVDINTALIKNVDQYTAVNSLNLVNEKFDNAALDTIAKFLSNAEINDVVIFYYAGHGMLSSGSEYYLCPYDIDFWKPEEKGVLFTDLEEIITTCNSRNKIIILDACHSGEVDAEELAINEANTNNSEGEITFRSSGTVPKLKHGNVSIFEFSRSLFVDTRLKNGNMIITSSSGLELSMEGKKWNNGLFTYFVIKALKDKIADSNIDGELEIIELFDYVQSNVSTVSKGTQNPTIREQNQHVRIKLY